MLNFLTRLRHAKEAFMRNDQNRGLLDCPHLDKSSVEQLKDEISDATVDKLKQELFVTVGKGIITKVLWLIGFGAVSVYAWLHSKGLLP